MIPTVDLTNDLLKTKMTDVVCSRSWAKDADTIKTPGVYPCGGETLNVPYPMGILVVFGVSNSIYGPLQLYFSTKVKNLYIRLFWEKIWTSWVKLAGSAA